MIGGMPPEDMARALLCLDEDKQATLFGHFSHDTRTQLAQALDRHDVARIFGAMAHAGLGTSH